MHQVGLKDSGSQNFSFLAIKRKAVGVVQILRAATPTARDKRFFYLPHMEYEYERSIGFAYFHVLGLFKARKFLHAFVIYFRI
jgi:hypothetical protein